MLSIASDMLGILLQIKLLNKTIEGVMNIVSFSKLCLASEDAAVGPFCFYMRDLLQKKKENKKYCVPLLPFF